jgi:hypothetical protein
MAFFTRPHFEDRQFVQYNDESITLSGTTYLSTDAQINIQPSYLNNKSDDGNGVFSGLTSGSTTISGLNGELISRVSGLVVQPPILNLLDLSGNTTGTTTVNVTGYVLKSFDSGGTAVWGTVASLSADTNTFLTGSSINCTNNVLTLGMNNGSIYNTDLTCVLSGRSNYVITTNFVTDISKTITHNLGIGDELSITLVDTVTNEILGGHVDNFQTNSFDVTFSQNYSSIKVVVIAGGSGNITNNNTFLGFSGGSGNCITDLYVTNIHGCSPITLHDNLTFNVTGGTYFTDVNTNLDVGVDTDPINGDLFKIYFGTSYFGIRNTGSTNSVESVFLGNDSLGDILQVTTDGIVLEQEITSKILDLGTISGGINVNIRDGNVQKMILSGDTTLNGISASTINGGDLTVHVYQDGSGGHTLTKGTNILTGSGSPISVTTGATTTDTLFFKTDSEGKYRLQSHTKDFN